MQKNKSYVLQDFWLVLLGKLNVEQLISLKTFLPPAFEEKSTACF